MESHYKEMLRFQLMDEINKISAQVATLGTPRGTLDRSLIARYGKLLFVCQQLMDTLPKLYVVTEVKTVEIRAEKETNAIIPQPVRGSFSRRFGGLA